MAGQLKAWSVFEFKELLADLRNVIIVKLSFAPSYNTCVSDQDVRS